MKVAISQINTIIGDFQGNRDKILDFSTQAAEKGADLIVFPELCICGYPPMDLLDHEAFVSQSIQSLRILQKFCPKNLGILVGYVDKNPSLSGRALQNTTAFIYQGEILHRQAKTLLPTYDVFDESRYFEPASERRVFSFKDLRIGVAVCEDIWWETEVKPGVRYPLDPVKDLLDLGAELLLVPSASPFFSGKKHIRHSLLSSIGKASGVPVIYTNMVGGNDSLIFDGYSIATAADGRLHHLSPGFKEDLAVVDITESPAGIEIVDDKYFDIEAALILGIQDYLAKCGFERIHLGLSGGMDSALVAYLATRALGPEKVSSFGLPSPYSTEASLNDAKQLALNLGFAFHPIYISSLFEQYQRDLAPIFQSRSPDITEENIQARIRGNLLMAISNKFGSLLLTTGNKSELAVGYATLYGDMCGSLAVIGDLFKTEVYELARYINRNGEIIPANILTKAPSAELRPGQKDQDSLPPYELLDAILKFYLLDSLTSEEIIEKGFSPDLVSRVLSMVGWAEYKRRQAPPVLKVSSRAFGTGRRMPIARRIYEA